jgi:hypothetical protein
MKDLVSLSEYKNYKGIRNVENDTKITYLISTCSTIARNFCGRAFIEYYDTSTVEYFDGTKTSVLTLKEFPLVELVSVEVSSDNVNYTMLQNNVDYSYDPELAQIFSVGVKFVNSKFQYGNTRVTYKGGYNCAPEDLKVAVMDLIHFYMSEEYTPRKSMDTSSIIHISSLDHNMWPAHIRRVFNNYSSNY